jgi:hypothetical protein
MSGFGDKDQFVNWRKNGRSLALGASPKTHFVTIFGSGWPAKLLFFRGFAGGAWLCSRFFALQAVLSGLVLRFILFATGRLLRN